MPNIIRPDCGWNLYEHCAFQTVSAEDLKNEDGFDLTGKTNIYCDLSAESANVQIQDFVNMENGKMYMLDIVNGSGKQLEVLLPDGITLYSSEITPANGMNVTYKFWTDGKSIFCDRAIYS